MIPRRFSFGVNWAQPGFAETVGGMWCPLDSENTGVDAELVGPSRRRESFTVGVEDTRPHGKRGKE
jgi:hypothetical protein